MSTALQTGYRHIDTAAAYGNERQFGEAIHQVEPGPLGHLHRDEGVDHRLRLRLHAARLRQSAGKLGVEQIGLLTLHQPAPREFDRTLATYHAPERLLADGKVRAIRVSNLWPST